MGGYQIIESDQNENKIKIADNIILHNNIMDILFKHKEEVYKRLVDLRGNFLIDHIAIKIINPHNELVIFSLTPSVEYNLIVQGLWKHDHDFSSRLQKRNHLHIWDEAYSQEYFNQLKYLKEYIHGFTCGFNIHRKYDAFNLIYSFATRSKNSNLSDYYLNHIHELSKLGDYGYKLIQSIYSGYCHSNIKIPSIKNENIHSFKSFLKLIVNNPKAI